MPTSKEWSDGIGRSDNRFRLTEEEAKLIMVRRQTGVVPDDEAVHSDRNVLRLLATNKKISGMYKAALIELDEMQRQIDLLCELDKEIHRPVLKLKHQEQKSGKSRSVIVLPFSDLHLGEVVDPDTVSHLNTYNVDTAKIRVKAYFEKVMYLTNLMRTKTKIDHVVLALLGDMINGDIHEELREENELTGIEAVDLAEDMLIEGIDFLRNHGKFKKISVACCFGNHGRTTRKPRNSTAWKNNLEYLLYRHLAKLYSGQNDITFQLTKGYHNYVEMWPDWTVRFHHGDKISYHGGVGGISIPVNKAVWKWSNIKRVKLDVFGHFHQCKEDHMWVSNGSVIGFNAYAMGIKADYEPPRQRFLVIEEDKGLTFNMPILLS